MTRTSVILLASAAVLLLAIGAVAYLHDERTSQEPPEPRPGSAAAARTSSLPDAGRAPNTDSGATFAAPAAQLALEIERALASRDAQQRETAFNSLLPQLLATDVARVPDLVARLAPAEARDALRDEVARQWIVRDRDAAISWMQTLADEAEREASASVAVRALAASDPAAAIELADRFGVGRDDGSLEHLVQIWATEDPDAARRWIESQPDNPRTAQLRARIEQARPREDSAPR